MFFSLVLFYEIKANIYYMKTLTLNLHLEDVVLKLKKIIIKLEAVFDKSV